MTARYSISQAATDTRARRGKSKASRDFSGRQLLHKDVKLEKFFSMGKSKAIPAGSTWRWECGSIYGPVIEYQDTADNG